MTPQASLNILRIPLATAGGFAIQHGFGYAHVLRFEDAAGNATLDGVIEVSFSVSEDDFIPMQYNNRVAFKADRGRVRWAAQAGLVAVLAIASDPNQFAADTPNPKQLVVSSGGVTVTAATVTVGTSAVSVAAASPTRQSVTIQNLGAADIFIGPSGVTTANGLRVASGEALTLDKQTAQLFAISGAAGNDVRVLTEAS
jgi:hypothetical protein